MRKRLIVFLQSLLILLLLCGVAYAAGETARVSTFGTAFGNALGKVGNKLSGAAEKVFWFLAILQMFWNCYQLLLEGKLESRAWNNVKERFELQVANAREWCDIVNSYFYRRCGIADNQGRTIY